MQFHDNGESPYNYVYDRSLINNIGYKGHEWKWFDFGQQTDIHLLNREDSTCSNDYSSKKPNCIDNYLSDKLGCVLPWSGKIGQVGEGSKICTGKDKYQTFKNLSISNLHLDLSDEMRNKGCLIPKCEQRKWNIIDNGYWAFENTTGFSFKIFHRTQVKVKKEVELYTFTNFFAEIGGYLGLFLGESLVSYVFMVIKWLQILVRRFRGWCKKRPGETISNDVNNF